MPLKTLKSRNLSQNHIFIVPTTTTANEQPRVNWDLRSYNKPTPSFTLMWTGFESQDRYSTTNFPWSRHPELQSTSESLGLLSLFVTVFWDRQGAFSWYIRMHSGCMKRCLKAVYIYVTEIRSMDMVGPARENWRELTQQVCFAAAWCGSQERRTCYPSQQSFLKTQATAKLRWSTESP